MVIHCTKPYNFPIRDFGVLYQNFFKCRCRHSGTENFRSNTVFSVQISIKGTDYRNKINILIIINPREPQTHNCKTIHPSDINVHNKKKRFDTLFFLEDGHYPSVVVRHPYLQWSAPPQSVPVAWWHYQDLSYTWGKGTPPSLLLQQPSRMKLDIESTKIHFS